jgi:hypothetical protein
MAVSKHQVLSRLASDPYSLHCARLLPLVSVTQLYFTPLAACSIKAATAPGLET